MSRARLRGAIVGCGRVASLSHMPGWQSCKDVELVAACDEREHAAQAFARRWGIGRSYSDLALMLETEKLDLVDVCTPPQTHCHAALQAMAAGLNVLVEKPMARDLREADEMVLASRKQGVRLCVVHNFQFSSVVRAARAAVEAGEIGEVLSAEVEVMDKRSGPLQDEQHWCHGLPGGICAEYAPHALYLISAFLGSIKSVSVIADNRSGFPWVQADEMKVLLGAEKGIGSFAISCNSRRPRFILTVPGTEGRIQIDNFALTMTRTKCRGNRVDQLTLEQLDLAVQLLAAVASSPLRALRGHRWYTDGHSFIIRGFARSTRDGVDPPVTGEDARETMRTLEEVCRQIGDGAERL
jgi:predicted dehydrogenase